MSLEKHSQKALARWQPPQFVAALITLVMLGVSLGYWYNEEQEFLDKRAHFFHEEADQVTQAVHRSVLNFDLVLRGVKGLYESKDDLSREDFRQYYEALVLEQMQPSLQGIAIAIRVPSAQKSRHLADMLSLGLTDYRVKPDGERTHYAPIILIEPFEGSNLKALGFDVASNPGLLGALE